MRLSLKNSNGARIGRKIGGSVRLAVKDSEGISRRAGNIESVAGKVSGLATAGAAFTASTGVGAPFAGGLGTLAVGAAAGQRAAGAIKSGADRVTNTRNTLNQVDSLFGR
tara:strand:+ start:1562 stop:1891 length:330 start_codon:yes stop_codon:yes gene_type:complete